MDVVNSRLSSAQRDVRNIGQTDVCARAGQGVAAAVCLCELQQLDTGRKIQLETLVLVEHLT